MCNTLIELFIQLRKYILLFKLLNRVYESGLTETVSDVDMLDLRTVVTGLIKIFQIKVHKLPSAHAVRVYMMLVAHLENHYNKPSVFENGSLLRYKVISSTFSMVKQKLITFLINRSSTAS